MPTGHAERIRLDRSQPAGRATERPAPPAPPQRRELLPYRLGANLSFEVVRQIRNAFDYRLRFATAFGSPTSELPAGPYAQISGN